MPHTIRNIQSPYIEEDFWTQYESNSPRMCLCVKVTPNIFWEGSNDTLGFTSNTRNMTLPGHSGVTFRTTPGISPTQVEQALDQPTNLELSGIYTALTFNQQEVLAGKWDYAEVEIFAVCWNNVDLGEFVYVVGNLGEIRDFQTHYTAELRGKMAELTNQAGVATSPTCRALDFRDDYYNRYSLPLPVLQLRCGHTATTVTIDSVAYNVEMTLTVDSVTDNGYTIVFTKLGGTANDVPDNFFAPNGKIVPNTTTNDLGTLAREIYESTTDATTITVKLRRRWEFTVTVGDTFDLVAACDRTTQDCRKYANMVNFKGEDSIPGLEAASRIV